jgi:hypothetical protein
VPQHLERTVVETLCGIETGRQGRSIGVEIAIKVVSQNRPAAVGIADEEGCFHVDGSSGQDHR